MSLREIATLFFLRLCGANRMSLQVAIGQELAVYKFQRGVEEVDWREAEKLRATAKRSQRGEGRP